MASQGELEEMLAAVEKHDIKVENNVFEGLDEVPRAVEMLKKGQYRGKACFVVDQSAVGVRAEKGKL